MPQNSALTRCQGGGKPAVIPTEISVGGQTYRIVPVSKKPATCDLADRGLSEALIIGGCLAGGLVGAFLLARAIFPPPPFVPAPPPPRPVIIQNPPAKNPNCVAFCGGN